MSRENVAIVRQVYEAAARRDRAAALSLYDSDVAIDVSRTHRGLMKPLYEGADHEALRTWSREWHDAWETVDYEIEKLIDAGDQVVGVVTVRGRGQSSRAEVEFLRAAVWTIRNGKVIRVVWFPSPAQALKAAGLSG